MFNLKKRVASGILTVALTLSVIIGFLGLANAQLQSANFAGLEASGTALKAQQLAKIKAVQADVTTYSNADTLAELRQLIGPTNLYRETTVAPETINPDGRKEKSVSIKIYKTNASTSPLFELNTLLSDKATVQGIPTGTVIWFAALSPPNGFIICNGQSTAAYPELAKIVGATVPDLRGEFIRGLDLGRGIDLGRIIRSFQIDELKSHYHTLPYYPSGSGGGGGGPDVWGGYGARTNDTGGNETRPRNIALLPCIKT